MFTLEVVGRVKQKSGLYLKEVLETHTYDAGWKPFADAWQHIKNGKEVYITDDNDRQYIIAEWIDGGL